jgi:hypothetical protein
LQSHHKTKGPGGIKEVVSVGEGLAAQLLGDQEEEKQHQRLLPKEAMEKIKEEHEATPITGNTLANYRNF